MQLVGYSPSEVGIVGAEELQTWRETHTLPVPGREHMPLFKRRLWDGVRAPGKWVHMTSPGQFEFRCSRGLVRRVVQDLGGQVKFNTAPLEEIEAFCAGTPAIGQLRDYQRRAVLSALNEGWCRIAYATNAGKGAVIAMLALFAKSRDGRALICCDEIAVFDALREELLKWGGIDPAVVKAGVTEPPIPRITLAMIPTLARRLQDDKKKVWAKWLALHEMLLLDEADKADANTWKRVMRAAVNTRWRVGFSGTFASDLYSDLFFDELMGPIVERVTNTEMIARGVSARPQLEVHAFESTVTLVGLPRGREWWQLTGPERRNLVYQRAVIHNAERHQKILSLIRPDTSTAVIVNRIEHGAQLAEAIPDAVFLDGSRSEAERIDALEAFRQQRVRVLIVTKILDRGTNRLGYAADLIFAAGEGSPTQVLQRLGRGLRRSDGKEELRLVDIVDRVDVRNAEKVLENAAGFLHAAAKKRVQVYAEQGFDLKIFR